MGEQHDRLIAGPNLKPPNAPDHPFWDAKYSKEKWNAFGEANSFYWKLLVKWEDQNEEMTPQDVKHEFDTWKENELKPGHNMRPIREAIAKMTLYDVWATASWKADEQLHTGSTSEPSHATIAQRAKIDRLTELVKEAHEQFEKPPVKKP